MENTKGAQDRIKHLMNQIHLGDFPLLDKSYPPLCPIFKDYYFFLYQLSLFFPTLEM